jgi:Ca2+-binding EF-hand superfamily protein
MEKLISLNSLLVCPSSPPKEQKVKKLIVKKNRKLNLVSFLLYDADRDDSISKKEMTEFLETALTENNLGIPKEQLAELIEETWKEADTDKDGKISKTEYSALAKKHPLMMQHLTVSTTQTN